MRWRSACAKTPGQKKSVLEEELESNETRAQ